MMVQKDYTILTDVLAGDGHLSIQGDGLGQQVAGPLQGGQESGQAAAPPCGRQVGPGGQTVHIQEAGGCPHQALDYLHHHGLSLLHCGYGCQLILQLLRNDGHGAHCGRHIAAVQRVSCHILHQVSSNGAHRVRLAQVSQNAAHPGGLALTEVGCPTWLPDGCSWTFLAAR